MEKSKFLKDDTSKDDWIMLLEIMLEWDAYLNSESMFTCHVKRLSTKHRYILCLIRKIARRTSGMGPNLVKFHIILHLVKDILQFGAPLEFNTGRRKRHFVQLPQIWPTGSINNTYVLIRQGFTQ